MQIKPCHVVLFTALMLAAAFVFFIWQRGAHIVFSWPWIAVAAVLLMFCALKTTVCGGGRCETREDGNGGWFGWFGF
jgi:hypothetical protein